MESASTTSSNLFDCHPLPHQQFSSRIAFANNDNTISKVRLNSLSNKKSTTRLPPIARYDSPSGAIKSIKYFNQSSDSIESIESNGNDSNYGMDPNIRIKQLERNLKFVKEDCHNVLNSLQMEMEDLKIKNRDLQFQLIMNGSTQLSQSIAKERVLIMPVIRGSFDAHIEQHINKLENEVKRLRYALGETIKMNAILKTEVQKFKKDNKHLPNESATNWLPSPTIGEFNNTFEQIYRTNKNFNTIEDSISLPRITNNSSK